MFSACSLLVPLLAAAAACAQTVNISHPVPGQTLTAGKTFFMQIESMASLTSFLDISVAVGIQSCATVPCSSLMNPILGNLLYSGNFTPKRIINSLPPYQNFSMTVPETFPSGEGLLSVAHFYAIGAGLEPILETKNISVQVSNPTIPS